MSGALPCLFPREATRPEVAPPANACDSHARVFGPADRYPVPKVAVIRRRTRENYWACCARLAFRPASLAQVGAHNRDNISQCRMAETGHISRARVEREMPDAPPFKLLQTSVPYGATRHHILVPNPARL